MRVAGGMRTGGGVPLRERAGPTSRDPVGLAPASGVDPPPGTACWIDAGPARVPGVILSWQQDPATGAWHALVSAWLPRAALQPRHD